MQLEETILTMLDQGMSTQHILEALSDQEKIEAQKILDALGVLQHADISPPPKALLKQAIEKASVTDVATSRLLVSEAENDSWYSRFSVFLTHVTMQKSVAIGAGSTLAVLLVIGTIGYVSYNRGVDPTVGDLAWSEESLQEDLAELDAFTEEEFDFEGDFLALAELDGSEGRSNDLEGIEAELDAAFREFESDNSDLENFEGDNSEVEQDLSTIS